jgi:hypothetical protein
VWQFRLLAREDPCCTPEQRNRLEELSTNILQHAPENADGVGNDEILDENANIVVGTSNRIGDENALQDKDDFSSSKRTPRWAPKHTPKRKAQNPKARPSRFEKAQRFQERTDAVVQDLGVENIKWLQKLDKPS